MGDSDPPTTSGAGVPEAPGKDPYSIQHRPRQRAKPPGINVQKTQEELGPVQPTQERRQQLQGTMTAVPLSKEQIEKAWDVLEQRRLGPHLVKYGCYASVGAIAYTYLSGFYHLASKNRDAWMGSFRSRIMILGPVISMYATAYGVIPFPFKEQVETTFHRPAITMYDIAMAKRTIQVAKDQAPYLSPPPPSTS